MSKAGEIATQLEAKIISLFPEFKKSPYKWNFERNNTKTSAKNFRVLPEDGNSIDGTMRTITKSQQFTVSFTTTFVDKNDSDQDLQAEIEKLTDMCEQLQTEATSRKFNIDRIMNVPNFSFSSPEIDYEEKTVSMSTTYTINYRMG